MRRVGKGRGQGMSGSRGPAAECGRVGGELAGMAAQRNDAAPARRSEDRTPEPGAYTGGPVGRSMNRPRTRASASGFESLSRADRSSPTFLCPGGRLA